MMDNSCDRGMYLISAGHINHHQHHESLVEHSQQQERQNQDLNRIPTQFRQAQQVSSHSDHHQMISSSYDGELININAVNYNFTMQEDTWTSVGQSNHNIAQVPPNQTDRAFKDNVDSNMSTIMEPFAINQLEPDSDGRQHDSYQHHSTMSEPIKIDPNDFNNNQQVNQNQLDRQQNLDPALNHIQESYADQLFSNTTFYSHHQASSNLTPAAYNHQDTERRYNLNSYNDNHNGHQLALLEDLPEIEQSQTKPGSCYAQDASTGSIHLQQYYEQKSQPAPAEQLYQRSVQLETPIQVVFKQNDIASAQQHQHPPLALQQVISADQYQVPRTGYNSLQQLTMNCNNYADQVTAAETLPICSPNQSMNKARSLKNRRGRPRKKGLRSKNKVNGKLWEFIRDLLLNDHTNPSFIRWERREDGVFKFVQSDKVAKMWGERKQNPKMTYEKLSRAMRYYYKSKVLLPVFGRRLVYKFGPNATGWLPEEGGAAY